MYIYIYIWVSQNEGYLFGCPYDKDHEIVGSMLGTPIYGNYHIHIQVSSTVALRFLRTQCGISMEAQGHDPMSLPKGSMYLYSMYLVPKGVPV